MRLQRSQLAAAALAALVVALGVQLARTAAESRRQAARIDALAGQARGWQQLPTTT